MEESAASWSVADVAFMTRALELARSGLAVTRPNPSVGCVLVQGDQIVGEGRTQAGGRPHGEAVALASAGESASGAHAYVTLEPCAHESARGPACSARLVQAGVAAVTISVLDPDPRTRGIGVERLQAAGVEVRVGLLSEAGFRQISGFEKRLRTGLPWVHVGVDDGSFDAVLKGAPDVGLLEFLMNLGAEGAMRLCIVPQSPLAALAEALGHVDSWDAGLTAERG